MFNARFKQQHAGLTWVEVLVTLAILGILLSAGVPSWRALQTQQAERRLLNDVERVLVFARNQAFLRGEALVLLPRVASEGWSSGMVLELKNTLGAHVEQLHTWRWHYPSMHLTWHGFLGDDALVVAHSPARLAMNGHFVLEKENTPPRRWVVNRFGTIRVQNL
jgi:prepilin-type N-terminal cleavage/methylation domain-containing protein